MTRNAPRLHPGSWKATVALLRTTAAVILWTTAAPGIAAARPYDGIAAIVNEEVITLGDVRRLAAPLLTDLDEERDPAVRKAREKEVLCRTLEDQVKEVLILQEADRLEVRVGEDEVDRFIADVKEQYGWDDRRLEEVVRSQGSTLEAYRRDIRRRLRSSRLIQARVGSRVRVTDEEVEAAYRRQYGEGAGAVEITARHILIRVPKGAPEAKVAAARARLEEARRRIEAGEDFAALAREMSEDASGPRGGELGTFRRGSLEPSFEDAAFQAVPGEVVGPVRTPFGLHLIQVTDRRTAEAASGSQGGDDARERIRAQLRAEALDRQLDAWVRELRSRAFVDVRICPTR